ncbi:MAG: hypothetical protein UX62_C0023G0003 [Microgenomates group bacterium GW2011_GWA2_46_7]|nr:MAG: hypothetical protein UX62_C0023G0003 [Microgenomates group bacterium GW2011_GWA2_46_7]
MKEISYNKEVVEPGDRASALARVICEKSFNNCKAAKIITSSGSGKDRFRLPTGILWRHAVLERMLEKSIYETIGNDGAGGKPQFFALVGLPATFRNLGWEIITMTADDIARNGGFPVFMVNEINAKLITKENFKLFEAMMSGYASALAVAGLANPTGEIAIMRNSITAFCDNGTPDQLIMTWGGTCIGLQSKYMVLDGSRIEHGMPIVGFYEPGYRCNGGGQFTKIIINKWGTDVEEIKRNPEAMKFIRMLTIPSQSYARMISRMLGWKPNGDMDGKRTHIAAVAHITGGGIWGKFREILPPGVGANLYDMPRPAPVLVKAWKLAQGTHLEMTPYDFFSTFHGGCGMLVVTNDPYGVIKEAQKDGVRAGIVGDTMKSPLREVLINPHVSLGLGKCCISSEKGVISSN